MNIKKLFRGSFFAAIIAASLYYILSVERRVFEMNQCSYELVSVALSTKAQVERMVKEIQHTTSNSQDREKLELIGENLELQWQNEKLVRELLNMFNLLRGKEMPLSEPAGKTKV